MHYATHHRRQALMGEPNSPGMSHTCTQAPGSHGNIIELSDGESEGEQLVVDPPPLPPDKLLAASNTHIAAGLSAMQYEVFLAPTTE